jgi:hypothetical protein
VPTLPKPTIAMFISLPRIAARKILKLLLPRVNRLWAGNERSSCL